MSIMEKRGVVSTIEKEEDVVGIMEKRRYGTL